MNPSEDSFLSHLFELRDRLIRVLLSVGIVFVCLFPWAKELYALLAQPLLAALPQGGQMIATDVVGVFLVPMKVALMVAFLIALPYVLYQIWAFVAPGLYSHEKRLALPLDDGYRKVPVFRNDHVHRFWRHLRSPDCGHCSRPDACRHAVHAQGMATLRHCRRFRDRGHLYAAGRGFAALAGHSALSAV